MFYVTFGYHCSHYCSFICCCYCSCYCCWRWIIYQLEVTGTALYLCLTLFDSTVSCATMLPQYLIESSDLSEVEYMRGGCPWCHDVGSEGAQCTGLMQPVFEYWFSHSRPTKQPSGWCCCFIYGADFQQLSYSRLSLFGWYS